MIGNDIVDLKCAAIESNWKRPRFLDKVFSEEEQQLILNSVNPSQMVWLLWSMKESAYKIYVQQFGKRFFDPKKLRCELMSLKKGRVSIENKVYITTSSITEDFIYTVARFPKTGKRFSECFMENTEGTTYKTQSNISEKRLLKTFSELKKIPFTSLKFKKNHVGVPKFYHNDKEQKQSFSITHHGRYAAFALSI